MVALERSVQIYQNMDFVVADQFHYVQISILVVMVGLVVFLGFGIYYPAAARVANTKVGVVDIAKGLSHRSIKSLHKHFRKAQKRLHDSETDTDSASDSDEDSDIPSTALCRDQEDMSWRDDGGSKGDLSGESLGHPVSPAGRPQPRRSHVGKGTKGPHALSESVR